MNIEERLEGKAKNLDGIFNEQATLYRKAARIIREARAAGFVDENGRFTEPMPHHGWRSVPPEGYVLCSDGVARKVLGRLPITADRAIALPLLSVVYHPDHPGLALDVDVCNDEVFGQAGGPPASDGSTEWFEYPIDQCYSTREAAKDARPGMKEDGK